MYSYLGDINNVHLILKEQLSVNKKYVTLLSFAMISTVFVILTALIMHILIFVLMGRGHDDKDETQAIVNMLYLMDNVINMVCLSLQYSFNKQYYDKYCGWFAACYTYLLSKGILKENQHETHLQAQTSIGEQEI